MIPMTLNTFRKLRIAVALLFVLGGSTLAVAGDVPAKTETSPAATPTTGATSLYTMNTPFRLFDPGRLSLHQSYSVSYFSGGGHSANLGVYTSSFGYRISDPLYVQLDLAVLHQPGALFSGDSRQLNASVRPNFFLRYAPSSKFNLMVDIRTAPMFNYGYGYGFGLGYRTWPY